MTTRTAQQPDKEPTPDFEERGRSVVLRWNSGELPFKDAINELNHLAQEAAASGHLANQGRIEHLLGYIQHYRGNLNTSNMHYERARRFFERVGNHRRIATMDLNMGENYRNKGEFIRARHLYHAAYEASRQLGDLAVQTMSILNEGLTLITMGQHNAALEALLQCGELCTAWEGDNYGQHLSVRCELHQGLAAVYLVQERFSEAWEQANLALEAATTLQQPREIGYANRILGEVLTALREDGEFSQSYDIDEYFQAAIQCFREVGAEGEMARTIFSQARSLAARGKVRAAARQLQQAMIIFTRLGMTDDAARAAEAQLSII